jgi:hypothetical protein
MATTISKLFPTGILQTGVELDEITYNSVKVGPAGVYAAQFDEISLAAGTAESRTSTGVYMVSGYFDEYTLPSVPMYVTSGLVLNLDAGDIASYPGSGTSWTDTVGGKVFTLFNGPTYNSANGGYINFVAASNQWANSTTSLSSLNTWTVEAWHYYTGTNTGTSPCIVTETYPGSTSNINYTLGSVTDNNPNLQAAFFDGAWRRTTTTTLTANNWYQIVGTYDGSAVKLYVNNTLINSTNYSGTPISSNGGIRLMRRWDLGQYWGGRLSIVRLYSSALTASEVSQNFNGQRNRFGI